MPVRGRASVKIVSMDARGMSAREIQGPLRELYGIDVSPGLVGAVTNAVLEEVAEPAPGGLVSLDLL
jgi:transposase-like protein